MSDICSVSPGWTGRKAPVRCVGWSLRAVRACLMGEKGRRIGRRIGKAGETTNPRFSDCVFISLPADL